jgi:hypothetical protein
MPGVTDRLLLDERIVSEGSRARTYASLAGAGTVRIEDEGGPAGTLSVAALDKVMSRYGRPLENGLQADGDTLDCGDGYRLRRFRFHAIVDAEGRDYLVWERPGDEPVAVIATHATAALRYLVLRLAGEH